MSALWRGEVLAAAMGGRPVGTLPEAVDGISIDTRSLRPGDAFFAIKGEKLDGHDYLTAATKAGASVLVVAEGRLPALGRVNTPMIVVPDVLRGLEAVALAARARTRARVIGVTGSAGKTTTKEMLRIALSSVGSVHAADRSFNNHWGVPLTLARLPQDCDYAVVEIGMNHAGEIAGLVRFVRPHIAVITLIAAAHIGHFKSLEEIARAKAEIFEGVEAGGHALVNRDDRLWKLLDKSARDTGVEHVWSFGQHARATFRLVDCDLGPDGSDVVARAAGKEVSFRVGAPGRHIVQNSLAVLGAAYLAGADISKAMPALAAMRAERGRGQRHVLRHGAGSFVLIDESYNANPTSMKAALDLLRTTPTGEGGRRIAVMGDMLELGDHAERLHADLAGAVEGGGVDLALLAGPSMLALKAGLRTVPAEHFETVDALSRRVGETVRAGDVVMVKSSNGIGTSRVVEALVAAHGPRPSTRRKQDTAA